MPSPMTTPWVTQSSASSLMAAPAATPSILRIFLLAASRTGLPSVYKSVRWTAVIASVAILRIAATIAG